MCVSIDWGQDFYFFIFAPYFVDVQDSLPFLSRKFGVRFLPKWNEPGRKSFSQKLRQHSEYILGLSIGSGGELKPAAEQPALLESCLAGQNGPGVGCRKVNSIVLFHRSQASLGTLLLIRPFGPFQAVALFREPGMHRANKLGMLYWPAILPNGTA